MTPRVFLADDSQGGWQWSDGTPGPALALSDSSSSKAVAGDAIAVVPAARMRTVAISIPPASADKLDAVVRFTLEDQLAGDVDLQHVVIASRQGGEVRVHVIDRRWLVDALDRLAARGIGVVRVVAESDLALRDPPDNTGLGTWIYRTDGGFLVERNGSVATLDQSGDALPSGLLLAIDRQAGSAADDASVVVRGPADLASRRDAWTRATSVRFDLRPEWSWRDADEATIAAAPDLLTPSLRQRAARSPLRKRSGWRTPVAWLAAALVLQVGATAIAWGSLQWRMAALERETASALRAAAPDLAGDPRTAWATYYAGFRHRSGKVAPGDALPMLADAAGGLREIGASAVRAIAFEGGQLTLDVERSAAAAIATALPRWTAAGLSVLQAETPSGIRVRLTRE